MCLILLMVLKKASFILSEILKCDLDMFFWEYFSLVSVILSTPTTECVFCAWWTDWTSETSYRLRVCPVCQCVCAFNVHVYYCCNSVLCFWQSIRPLRWTRPSSRISRIQTQIQVINSNRSMRLLFVLQSLSHFFVLFSSVLPLRRRQHKERGERSDQNCVPE